MSDTVSWSGYITVGINNPKAKPHLWRSSAKLSVNKPSVSGSEIALKFSIDLPISLFVRPQIEARIKVPESSVTPLTIDMEVLDNVQELIAQQTGFDVRLVPMNGKEGK